MPSVHFLNRINTGRSKICFGFHSLGMSSFSHQNHNDDFGNNTVSIESNFSIFIKYPELDIFYM